MWTHKALSLRTAAQPMSRGGWREALGTALATSEACFLRPPEWGSLRSPVLRVGLTWPGPHPRWAGFVTGGSSLGSGAAVWGSDCTESPGSRPVSLRTCTLSVSLFHERVAQKALYII